ncbi:MAG TPA: hypothetical protein VFM96_06130 [Gaiellaceae bacterium]|nr:hypothetical protein [Gaiellaceae bacterium]
MAARGLLPVFALVALAGCGATHHATATTTSPPPRTTTSAAAPPPSALQAEATSKAAGDIPDNQVFLRLSSPLGFSMKYPEGWAQLTRGSTLTIRDKNNIVRVVVTSGAPTVASIRQGLRASHVTAGPTKVTISGASAYKVSYTTQSAPNAVTGKRVTLVVDRYYLVHAGKEAIVDLGTPVGVDNVDAYRMMIESFQWK